MGNGIEAPVTVIEHVFVINFPTAPGGTPSQNQKNIDWTFTLADGASMGAHVYHAAGTPATFTIPANKDVPFAIGEALFVVNGEAAGTLTIELDESDGDAMFTEVTGSTSSVILAACTSAYFLKVAAKEWRAYPGA